MKVGFIGLGIMGKPMAKNLLKASHDVIVLSTNTRESATVFSVAENHVTEILIEAHPGG